MGNMDRLSADRLCVAIRQRAYLSRLFVRHYREAGLNVGHDLPRALWRGGALASAALACTGAALASNASPDATIVGHYSNSTGAAPGGP